MGNSEQTSLWPPISSCHFHEDEIETIKGLKTRVWCTLQCITLSVLVSWGFQNKAPPTSLLKTTGMYHLAVPEARSPRSRCQQGHALPEACGGVFPHLVLAAGGLPVIIGIPLLAAA